MVEEGTSERNASISGDVINSIVFTGDRNEHRVTQITQTLASEVKNGPLISISPYKGLKKFEQTDKNLFFGRDQFVERLLDDLNQTNLLLLLGGSGSGKSSVVRAGLIPELAQRWGDCFLSLTFNPDQDPFESLYASLLNHYRQGEAQFVKQGKVETLIQMVETLKAPDAYWLIFIDQFEELFPPNQVEKCNQFVEGLVRLDQWLKKQSPIENCRVKVVAAMRADLQDRLSPYSALVKATDYARPFITELQPDELRLAIEQPSAHHGVVFEDGLVEEIIKSVKGQAGYLPLLQYTLNLLWKSAIKPGSIHDRTLDISTYRKLGGVRGGLQKHVDEIYGTLPEEEQLAAQRIFLKLVDIGKDAESEMDWKPLRRRALRSSFSNSLEQQVLVKLIDSNLLISDCSSQAHESTVEVAHEVLLTAWTMLETWIRENRQAIKLRNQLDDDVARWKEKKSEDELWSGSKLARILELNQDLTFNEILGGFDESAKGFIKASLEVRDRRLKQVKRRATIAITLAALTTLTSIIAILTSWQSSYRERTARSLQLATASSANLTLDTTRSLLLAIQATTTQDTFQANLALWNSFQLNHERWLLVGHRAGIKHAEFDPRNPKRILTVSDDHSARVWDLDNLDHPIVLEGHRDTIISGSFDPVNSNRVLTVSFDGTARIWNLNNPNNPIVLKGHKGPINYGIFDLRTSNQVLTVGSDGTARVWNVNNPKFVIVLKGHKGSIWSGSFDPQNSNRVLTTGNDGTARVWNLNAPESHVILKGHSGDVLYGSFDPKNYNRVLTVGADRTLRVWDLNKATQLMVFKGHEAPVTMVRFDPFDTNRVLTVSEDSTARVWSLNHPENPPIVLRGHKGEVTSGNFSPNVPNLVLTSGFDGTTRVWDLKDPNFPKHVLYGHTNKVTVAVFNSSNSSDILTASEDGTARIWNINNNLHLQSLAPDKIDYGYINATFSLKVNNQVLVVSRNGTLKRWNLDQSKTSEPLLNLGSIETALFAPSDPSVIATIGKDGRSYIWDLNISNKPSGVFPSNEKIHNISFDRRNSKRLLLIGEKFAIVWNSDKGTLTRLPSPSGTYTHGSFDPNDDNRVALADSNGVISIWNIKDVNQPELEIPASQKEIWYISFDPNNSSRILSVGSDKIARIWDIKNQKEVTELIGHQDTITYASFDPKNSNRILTVGNDGEVYLWDQRYPNAPIIIHNSNTRIIDASFDPYDSNRIIIASEDGVRIFAVGGTELVKLAWLQSSRCLTSQESNGYELSSLDVAKVVSDYFKQSLALLRQGKYRPYCFTK